MPFMRLEVLPLINALSSADRPLVRASLRAIVRLPLEVEVWREVTRVVLDLLGTLRLMDESERGDVIDAAAYVPVAAVRQRLGDLARTEQAQWITSVRLAQLPVLLPARLAAAYALARAADQAAVPPLADIAAASDGERRVAAIHGLSMLDASSITGLLREVAERDRYAEARLFAGVALARAGDINPLATALQSLDRPDVETLWLGQGDPMAQTALLQACGPLPGPVWVRLQAAARKAHLSGYAQQLLADLSRTGESDEAGAGADVGSSSGTTDAAGVAGNVDDRRQAAATTARSVLAQLRESMSGSWITHPGLPSPLDPANTLTYLSQADSDRFVTDLFALADGDHWTFAVGNWLVSELIPNLREPFHPDVRALFDAGKAANPYQLAWTMSRAEVRTVVETLVAIIADPADTSQAAQAAWLIEHAVTYSGDEYGPIFGGGGAPAPLAPPRELIDLEVNGTNQFKYRRRRRRRRGAFPESRKAADTLHEETPPRWILAKVYDTTDRANPRELTRGFQAEAPHEIVVMVGRQSDWDGALSATGRPEESVDAKLAPGQADLLVMLFIPGLEVADTRSLTLPPRGPSEKVRFGFTAPAADQGVEGWISLLHRGKILQTAVLSGFTYSDLRWVPPGSEMSFRLAVIRPATSDLGTRPSFDAALLAGTGDTVPVVGILEAKAVPFSARHLDPIVQAIRLQLSDLTNDPAAFTGLNSVASFKLLSNLARRGRELYELLGSELEKGLPDRDLSRIQIVLTDPSDFIPVEFVYDLPTPSKDAGLCPNWQKALHEGRCDPQYHPAADLPEQVTVVCPLGFWGLTKVIERQLIDPDEVSLAAGKAFAIRAEPTLKRPSLENFNGAVFAWSDRVNATVTDQSDTVLQALNTVTGNRAVTARTWEEWVAAISERGPSLLVLLSHTVTDRGSAQLEIGPDGTGSRCERIEVVQGFVKKRPADAPVVLLLGCETAVARNDSQTFVARFRDEGAALVVGTIAPVLGEHAAPVASTLVQTLSALMSQDERAVSGDTPADEPGNDAKTFGDAMVEVRRKLLASGELTALCVTAFGDASWRLGGQPGK
jgi:hypothetical protein